jgi:hypothetical protein
MDLKEIKKVYEKKFDLLSVSFWDGKYKNAYKIGREKLFNWFSQTLKKEIEKAEQRGKEKI